MNPTDIRTILLKEWDPLGVGDNPHLADEYDAYIPEIVRMMQRGSDATMVDRYLREIEAKLGVSPPSDGRMQAATRLVEKAR